MPPLLSSSSSRSIVSSPNNWFITTICIYFFAQFHEDLIAMAFGASASSSSYYCYYCYGARSACPTGNAYLIACDAVLSVIAVLYFLTRLSKSSSSSSKSLSFSVWSGLLHIALPVGLMSLLIYSCIVLESFVPFSCGSSNPAYRRVLMSKALMVIVLALMMIVDVTTGVLLSGFTRRQHSPSTTTSSSDAEQVENEKVCSVPTFSLSSFLSLFSLTGRLLFIVSFLMFPFSISSIAINSVTSIAISFNIVLAVIYAACLLFTVVSHRLLWWRIHQRQQGEQQPQQWQCRSRLHSLFPFARLLASSTVRRQLSSKSAKQALSASSSSIPASSATVAPSSSPSSSASASSSSSGSSTSSTLLGVSDPSSHDSELTNTSLMQPMIHSESDIPPSLSASAPPQPSSSSSLPSSSYSISSTPPTSCSQSSSSSSFSGSGARARHLLTALLCLFTVVMFAFALVTFIVEIKHGSEEDTQAIIVTSLNCALVTIAMIRVLFAFGCLLRRLQIQIHYVATNRKRKGKKGEGEGEVEIEGEGEDEDDEEDGEERMELQQQQLDEHRDELASSTSV